MMKGRASLGGAAVLEAGRKEGKVRAKGWW